MGQAPLARKAGRGLVRLLRGLFGRKNLEKARDSVEALAEEYKKGRDGEDEEQPPPRRISHREVKESEEPPPASEAP